MGRLLLGIHRLFHIQTQNSSQHIQPGGRSTFNGRWQRNRSKSCSVDHNTNESDCNHTPQSSCGCCTGRRRCRASSTSNIGAGTALCVANAKFYGLASGDRVRNARRIGRYWAIGSIFVEFAGFVSKSTWIRAFRGGFTCSSDCCLSHRSISVGLILNFRLLSFWLYIGCKGWTITKLFIWHLAYSKWHKKITMEKCAWDQPFQCTSKMSKWWKYYNIITILHNE